MEKETQDAVSNASSEIIEKGEKNTFTMKTAAGSKQKDEDEKETEKKKRQFSRLDDEMME